jgi:hypothetical protein
MGDRSVPPEEALSGAGNPEEPDNLMYREPRVVQHFYGPVSNIEHAENVNSGDIYGELSLIWRIMHRC